jgi:hypothetical protein
MSWLNIVVVMLWYDLANNFFCTDQHLQYSVTVTQKFSGLMRAGRAAALCIAFVFTQVQMLGKPVPPAFRARYRLASKQSNARNQAG